MVGEGCCCCWRWEVVIITGLKCQIYYKGSSVSNLWKKKKLTHYFLCAVSGDNKNSSSFISILLLLVDGSSTVLFSHSLTFLYERVCVWVVSQPHHDTPRIYFIWQTRFPNNNVNLICHSYANIKARLSSSMRKEVGRSEVDIKL